MHQAQGAQRLDQRQFAGVEVVELLVAVHQLRELAEAFLAVARQHHPQVLHRRAHAAVIQVDDMEHLVAAHHVAGVAVTVHADVLVRRGLVNLFHTLEQVAGHGLVGRQQAFGNEVAFKQGGEGVVTEILHPQGFAVFERAGGAHRVQTPQQLPEPVKLIEVARLRRAAATARKQGEAETCVFEQALAVVDQRGDHRYIALGQFEGEAVFFQDRLVGPALGAIELGDQRFGVFDAHLVHAVFVAVERQNPRVAEETDAFDGVEHQVWGECFKRVGHANSCAQQGAASGRVW